MNPLALPVRRPMATSMLFLAIVLLGLMAWRQMPVELFPDLVGDQLTVFFSRPGGEPEVVEREILLPLESRVSGLPQVVESWGEVQGSSGSFRVTFERGVDLKVREVDVQRIAADLAREQPPATVIAVRPLDTSLASRFAMVLQVTGGEDRHALHDLVEELIEPRLASISGVGQVVTRGGGSREVAVSVDPAACAALDVTTNQVIEAVGQAIRRLRFVGGIEDGTGRTAVMLDGRPRGLVSLRQTRIVPDRPVLLHHVAQVELTSGREQGLFRVNGEPAVGLWILKENGANLVRLGRDVRRRIEELRREFRPLGLELLVGFDGAELVEDQIRRLGRLALSGFLIALVVLYLFLRQWRAVAVVGVAVPVSLLAALAFLYVGGQTLNLLTLFGLAVGIGLLVDNSVVVYEAVQRQLERGCDPARAALVGVQRTVRAIVAASATSAVVFLPLTLLDIEGALVRALIEIVALAILLPLLSSLLVAVGLVPLLAHRLAAPAALRRVRELARRREERQGLDPPDRVRTLFGGLLSSALRRPSGWIAGVLTAILLTVFIALPWVVGNTAGRSAPEADQLRLEVRLPSTRSALSTATGVFQRLEEAALALDGVERVESLIQEDGGSLIVRLKPGEERGDTSAGRVRQSVRQAAEDFQGVEVLQFGEGGDEGAGGQPEGGGIQALLGQGPGEVVLSGPEAGALERLAREVRGRLESIPEVADTWTAAQAGLEEVRVTPDANALSSFGITLDQVMPSLRLAGREGVRLPSGFSWSDGRELPLVVYRRENGSFTNGLADLRLTTPVGPLPMAALASIRRMPASPALLHHNGRRELVVRYRLEDSVASTGPSRQRLDREIETAVRESHRPAGYTVELGKREESTSWFRRLLVPVILLLFLVLAMTFESLTMPVLVLLSLPLTLLGATWALALAGMPLDMMALVGALVLLGLTVNPAILLVDRMQRRVLVGGWSAGAAALAAVRERSRPVLMTTATTVVALWPLALVTGQENEIWPPFATIVMGGLATSTVLTLLVIPVGFVLLQRLDRVFGRLGPWILLGWLGAIGAVMAPLIINDVITTLRWQLVTGFLVAGVLLGVAALVVWRPELPEPEAQDGPPAVEVRCLRKVYGLPGPVGRALNEPERFARRVLEAGGRAFDARDARERLPSLLLVATGLFYLSQTVASLLWGLVFLFLGAVVGSRLVLEVRRLRGRADAVGRVEPGGLEGLVAALLPWLALGHFAYTHSLAPLLADSRPEVSPTFLTLVALVLGLVQLGRRTARRLAQGDLEERVSRGGMRYLRTFWRRLARRVFGLDLPRQEVLALAQVNFRVEGGMVGILGPNGAGKTTLLRQLAGILDSTRGRITLGGVPLEEIRRHLARWVGYLPQDTSLPKNLTAREYLVYFASHYQIPPREIRQRVETLLEEVGLAGRADEKIGGYSGGMRQRVAVARTLLRLPPVIIVDEPTVGLDPRERIRFRNLLVRLARDRVVLFSTHVVEDVAVACDRVLVLARGRLVFDGPPQDLSDLAADHVWELHLAAGEDSRLPDGTVVVDQLPQADGGTRLRVLSRHPPHPQARSVAPTAEDGYMELVGGAVAG